MDAESDGVLINRVISFRWCKNVSIYVRFIV